MSVRRAVSVNEAFRPQRVTGQQRYATELTDRLVGRAGVFGDEPTGWWAGSTLRTWLWVSVVLPWRARRRVLVTLTSRSPLWHPRHIVVVHDLFVLTNPEWYSKKYYWTHAPLLRAQLRTARQLVAVSEPVADQVRRYTSVPVRVAPNAPSPKFARGEVDAAVLEARQLRASGYVLAVGSLDPRKNLGILAAAYAQLNREERQRTPLVVVGGGADIFAAAGIDWPDGTILAGYVDDDELVALYRGAAGVIFPTLAEGFGLPVVEAAMVGTPLAVSDLAVFRWVIGDGPAEYFDPTDVVAVAGAIRRLAAGEVRGFDATESEQLAARFSWDASAATLDAAARDAGGRP